MIFFAFIFNHLISKPLKIIFVRDGEMIEISAARRRYIFGLCLILLVVLCWVSGDAFTKVIFHTQDFDKPFFVVYFKSAMFTVYLLKLLKFLPDKLRAVFSPERNPDDLLGPSSYEKLEYSDDDSEMVSETEQEELLPDLSIQALDKPINGYVSHRDVPKKSSLKKAHNLNLETSFLTAMGTTSPGTLSPNLSVSNFESSTSSRRIKFRNVAEVRCLASHDLTLQREARRPYNSTSSFSRFTFKQHMYTAILYTLLWFIGNYFNVLALSKAKLSYVEILSATSSVFVLFLGAAFPVSAVDKISVSKIVSVIICFIGVALLFVHQNSNDPPTVDILPIHIRSVTVDSRTITDSDNLFGSMFAIGAAFIYAVYVVYFRKVAGSAEGEEEKVDIVLFLGTVGLLSSILLLPLFPILHYSDIETFSLPNLTQLKYLLITALVGTVISDLLWLWSTLLTSSLVATIGLALTTPVSLLFDILIQKNEFSFPFFVGTAMIMITFIILNILSFRNYSDPVLDLYMFVYHKIKLRCSSSERDEISALLQDNVSTEGDV